MMQTRTWSSLGGVVIGAAFCAGVAAGCGPSPAASVPVATASPSSKPGPPSGSAIATTTPKPFDPCDDSPPLTVKFSGVLRDSRCEYDKFPIMADVATMLGVECRYCHVPDPTDAKKEIYPVMTPRKEIANWMRTSLMSAIKPADGSKLECKSCHLDDKGKPIAKILGIPRNPSFAHEWMSLVMTTKFVVASTGEKLKCKHCHVDNIGTPGWQPKVILSHHIPPT